MLALAASTRAEGASGVIDSDTLALIASACAPSAPGTASCLAQVHSDRNGNPLATDGPVGLTPADLVSAYRLPGGSAGTGHTVAIVDAFDDPTAEDDLAIYRKQFGLPECTTDNGCFRKVDQRGSSDYPVSDVGWALEESLDVDMVSAVCPNCHILLVEADDNSSENLAAAVDEAVRLGATEVSNSYGSTEFPQETEFEKSYHHPGVAITVSSGDSAYGPQFPAASRYVTAVGGTSLIATHDNRGWAERAWSGAGSGCSAYIAKPAWQHDALCPTRTIADVSAVADPATGVALFDNFGGVDGWVSSGGTSVASPIMAGIYALAGSHPGVEGASLLYRHPDQLFDVTAWENGFCGNYLCEGAVGYDGPTGLGTPAGTGDFR